MQSTLKKSVFFAAAFIVFHSGMARAATVEVKVPFPFLVHGQMLPAGQYRVEREGTDVVLIRGEKDTHAAAFVMTTPAAGRDPSGNTPTLTFTQHETQRRLASIWESETDGRSLVDR